MALTIQNYLENCTAVINPSTVETNSNVFITITANNGYVLNNMPFFYISLSGFQVSKRFENFSYNNDKTVATININLATEFTTTQQNNLQYLRLYGQAQQLPTNIIDVEIETANNCNVLAPTSVDTLNEKLSITITANENYIFQTAPYIDVYGVDVNDRYYLELNTENTEATINFNFSDFYNEPYLSDLRGVSIVANAAPNITYRNYGAINVYVVNYQNLNDFANQRFSYVNNEKINLGDFIISLKNFYFNIDNNKLLPTTIKCGNHETNINAFTPVENIFEFDFGTITILPTYNNILDYQREMKIFLPFYGFANFSNDYINKEINLKYFIDIVSNKGVAKLIHNNIILETFDLTPTLDINFKYLNYFDLNNNTVNLQSLEPYVYIKSYNGFVPTDNADDNENITLYGMPQETFIKIKRIRRLYTYSNDYLFSKEEFDMLENELKNGVFI